jgi:hypothetical protein
VRAGPENGAENQTETLGPSNGFRRNDDGFVPIHSFQGGKNPWAHSLQGHRHRVAESSDLLRSSRERIHPSQAAPSQLPGVFRRRYCPPRCLVLRDLMTRSSPPLSGGQHSYRASDILRFRGHLPYRKADPKAWSGHCVLRGGVAVGFEKVAAA